MQKEFDTIRKAKRAIIVLCFTYSSNDSHKCKKKSGPKIKLLAADHAVNSFLRAFVCMII